ncbi:MAG: UvrD-helicase domain-containing protein [Proteobacteria bacterium]|nr:UvrD-helicase domain-containing protein [Pseudomonadota bacterium]
MSGPHELSQDDPAGGGPPPAAAAAGPDLSYLNALNPAQREAVEALDGPVLVLAGAGTGKTRVLTVRLAHILAKRRAWPGEILAVTFTNKAAREMKGRVAGLIGRATEGIWLGTFHALGARILRRHAELVGLEPNFTILDTDDQIRLLKQVLEAEDIDEKRWPARVLLGLIEKWKNRGLRPEKASAAEAGDFAGGEAIRLYKAYQERLKSLNAADFGDLLMHGLTLFTDNPKLLQDYHRRFKYILVDEYQDANVAQYLWLRLLAQSRRNICCVGDDDQSIYGWRGAEVGNILKFERDFPGARVIRLEQNYRSTQNILSAASGLIAHNQGRLGKTLWTAGPDGDKVVVRGVWDGEEEARGIGDEIEALQARGHALNEIAILVRAGFQTREFEERFITLGLPYRVIGGPRFYERLEIRDAIAYLRVIHQPGDDLAFERIVNTPRRGIGAATLRAVHRLARIRSSAGPALPLAKAARRLIETDDLRPRVRNALKALIDDFDRWRALADRLPHVELVEIVLAESGYAAMWKADRSPDAPGRLENLKELVAAMVEFEDLAGFLEHVSLVMEVEASSAGDMVNLITLHGAKGLEFDTVFLPGWEEGLLPHPRALAEGGTAALEEERRLAYVGLTRARQRVWISFAAERRVHNLRQSSIPSRFVEELPEAHIETVIDPGLYAGSAIGGPAAGGPAAGGPTGGGLGEAGAGFFYGGGTGPAGGYTVGLRVFHQKFGYGRVLAVDGDKLEVAFDKAGTKKVIDSFVEEA